MEIMRWDEGGKYEGWERKREESGMMEKLGCTDGHRT